MNPEEMRTTPAGYFTSRWGEPEYTDWLDESMSWKTSCYIGDWSFMWERRYTGSQVLEFFSKYTVNSFAKFEINQAKHAIHTNQDGKIIHEGIFSRVGEEEYVLFGRGSFLMDFYLEQEKRSNPNLQVNSEELDLFVLQVSGPTALATAEKATGQNLQDVKFMRSTPVRVAGHDIRALRQGMAGGIGFDFQGPREHIRDVREALIDAGKDYGIRELGGRTVFINHLEACFPTIIVDYLPAIFGDDMGEYREHFLSSLPAASRTFNITGSFESQSIEDYYRSPVELGWGKVLNFDHDFVGRASLEIEKANPRRVIRTLRWNPDDVADVYASFFGPGEPYRFMEMPRDLRGYAWNDKVVRGDEVVGVSTSRGYSYYFRDMLSLAVLDLDVAELGTQLHVIWGEPGGRQKSIRVEVARAPYQDDAERRGDLQVPAHH
jgi:vanillate/3-O-methylgallate O-demethylase